METRSDFGSLHRNTAPGAEENSLFETLSRVERDVNDLIEGLALLGVKRCFCCKHFYRCSDPGTLFDYGRLVCFACIPDWWTGVSRQLGVAEREKIESKLSTWLRKYHGAEIVKEAPEKLPHNPEHEFQIVTSCFECRGSGKLMEGERCRFCNGLGTVWIVVPK
jgi:hypothetical protein